MKKILKISLLILLTLSLSSCNILPNSVQAETVERIENEYASLIEFLVEDNVLYWRNKATNVMTPVVDLSTIFQTEVVVGPQGEIGPQGIAGPQGEQGPEGLQGERGFSGSSGGSGPAGATGGTGAQGPTGATGESGPQGEQGIEGEAGPQGEQGIQGIAGEKVTLSSSGTSVYWKYENDLDWNLLFEIPTITESTTITIESSTPEFQTNSTHVQWKYTTNTEWIDLFEIPTHKTIVETITTTITETNIIIEVKDLSTIIEEVAEGIVRFAQGSAVIYKKEGNLYYAVTNNHVYGAGTNISYLVHGNHYSSVAILVGRDPSTDLAVIKFESLHTLPIIVFGDSNKTKVGETVFAIGNPNPFAQYELTVTQGIISSRNKVHSQGAIAATHYIQHDAGTGPGNSGGGLFNTYGELIGITNMTSNSNFDNMALAVISNIVQRVILDLEAYETETSLARGQFYIKLYNNPEPCNNLYGVCIETIDSFSLSTAQAKNLQPLDLIVSYKNERMENFVTVYNVRQFNELVLQTRVGELVSIQYYRNGVLYTSNPEPMSS